MFSAVCYGKKFGPKGYGYGQGGGALQSDCYANGWVFRAGFYTLTIYDALVCLTACYPKKFGPRGIGHAGVMWIGLQCDIEDEGYASPPYSYATIRHYFSLCVCACVLPLCPFVNPN